ncbi:hypothetical protein E2C01_065329 [Portunus trituberculatus]|uniref:Uncharacterized protein n=1 Tax=Portunus trituberculatus TaxID=210409 RepID=A0A5B7HE79_PORTR|nr:hypothetical protein [Portunus trituberculatus]
MSAADLIVFRGAASLRARLSAGWGCARLLPGNVSVSLLPAVVLTPLSRCCPAPNQPPAASGNNHLLSGVHFNSSGTRASPRTL